MDNMLIFVKFGEEKYMNDLIKNGNLFLNTVTEFKKIDDDFRGDKHEGVSDIIQSQNARLELTLPEILGGEKIILDGNNGLVGQVLMSNTNFSNTNIYSLYMIPPEEDFKIDDRMFQFGKYAAIITNPIEFLKRVERSLEELNLAAYMSQVKYLERNDFEGEMSIFNKFSEYSYQNEYRIHVINTEDKPLIINVGSLEDIGQVIPCEYFNNMKLQRV